MRRIKAAASAAILSAATLTFTASPASAVNCEGWADIFDGGPILIETATGQCSFMESGSSVYPSENGSALINLLTLPIGDSKWFQINIRDFSGLSLLFDEGNGTNTWYN